MEKVICQICREEKELSEVRPGNAVRGAVRETIKKKFPQWTDTGFICLTDLNRFRTDYVQEVLEDEMVSITTARAETRRKVCDIQEYQRRI